MYKILAVDYANMLYRAYWSTKGSDVPGLSIFRFAQSLHVAMRNSGCNNLLLAGESFSVLHRKKMDPSYKSNRTKASIDPLFLKFRTCLYKMLVKLNLDIIHYPGFEGDDVIGTMCERLCTNDDIYILSLDKDFYGLMRDNVKIVFPSSQKKGVYTNKDFLNDFGFYPSKYYIYKALLGDRSDNIVGVSGIGPINAHRIMLECDNSDHSVIFSNIKQCLTPKEYKDFEHALKLVRISNKVPPKVYKSYLENKEVDKRNYRSAKKVFVSIYGEHMAEGTINEFKKLFELNSLRSKIIDIIVKTTDIEKVLDRRPLDSILKQHKAGALFTLTNRQDDLERFDRVKYILDEHGIRYATNSVDWTDDYIYW